MKRTISGLAASGVMLGAALAASAFAAEPTGEQWRYQTSMNMAGISMDLPPAEQCQRSGQAEAPPVRDNCTTTNVSSQGNTTRFDVECGPPAPMTGTGTTTLTADTMDGTYTLTSGAGAMSFTVHGTKLGTCTPQ